MDTQSVCYLLQEREGFAGCPRNRGTPVVTHYFQDHLNELKEGHLSIDPNRRDLLYCLGSNEERLRYTSMQRRSETKAKLHEKIRSNIEVAAGVRGPRFRGLRPQIHTVNLPSRKTVNIEYFDAYLQQLWRKETSPQFRKLKFSKFNFVQKSEAEFIKKVKMKFGDPNTLSIFLGDWRGANSRFHAPSKVKGFRDLFKKAGYQALLVDEHRTSSVCHERQLIADRLRESPRPWRRGQRERVHGLLAAKAKIVNFP